MNYPHNIKIAKKKTEDPTLLADHILNLVGEGQDFLKAIYHDLDDACNQYLNQFDEVNNFNLSNDEIKVMCWLKGVCLSYLDLSNRGDIEAMKKQSDNLRAVLRDYFENQYCKYFLGMEIRSFFVYTHIVKLVAESMEITPDTSSDEEEEWNELYFDDDSEFDELPL